MTKVKIKMNRNKYSSKSKMSSKIKISQNFIVSDEIFTKCNDESQIFPSLELLLMESKVSSPEVSEKKKNL